MTRTCALSGLILAAILLSGCTKSEEPTQATRAAADLMPAGMPIDESFVADQGSVKLAVAREVPSYEPLESFRRERPEVKTIKRRTIEELTAEVKERPVRADASAPAAAPGGGPGQGFWKKLGGKLMGGGPGAAPPPGRPADVEEPDADEPSDDDDADDTGSEDADDEDEASADDVEDSEEEDSGDDEDDFEDDDASDDDSEDDEE